jgi:hypothetical protein
LLLRKIEIQKKEQQVEEEAKSFLESTERKLKQAKEKHEAETKSKQSKKKPEEFVDTKSGFRVPVSITQPFKEVKLDLNQPESQREEEVQEESPRAML